MMLAFSVMPGSMVACRPTPWTQTSRLPTRLQMSSSVLCCELSSLSISHVPTPKKPFTETHCSESALRKDVLAASFSINTSPREQSTVSAGLDSYQSRTHCHCHLETTELIAFRVFDQHLLFPTQELSWRSPHVLWPPTPDGWQRQASDDEFSIQTKTPAQNLGSHLLLLAGLACMYKIFSTNSRTGVLSLHQCSLCVLASSHRCRCLTSS